MASNSTTDKELQAIHKELKELNRRLDRLCRASIFSLDPPVIKVEADDESHNFYNAYNEGES